MQQLREQLTGILLEVTDKMFGESRGWLSCRCICCCVLLLLFPVVLMSSSGQCPCSHTDLVRMPTPK
jgi:hypothetical protein